MVENTVEFLVSAPAVQGHTAFIFAHGAGAPMDSSFMETISTLLAAQGILVLRFEFPYMAERRTTGKKRPPDRAPVLLQSWQTAWGNATANYPHITRWFIGGKSMGGRMATLIADSLEPAGCVCLGYPFHPPGKPEKQRTEHLVSLSTPLLIIQGTRDKLGDQQEVAGYRLPASFEWLWLEDGDHDLKPRVKSGFTHQQHLTQATERMIEFMS